MSFHYVLVTYILDIIIYTMYLCYAVCNIYAYMYMYMRVYHSLVITH